MRYNSNFRGYEVPETESRLSVFPNLNIFRKVLISLLSLALLPLIIFAIYSIYQLNDLGDQLTGDTVSYIDNKTRDVLKLQASNVSALVSSFLQQRETDLITLSHLEPDADNYLGFYQARQKLIWLHSSGGANQSQAMVEFPLYKEINFIRPDGMEVLRISNGQVVPENGLKNVANPQNTRYKHETYFSEAVKLGPGGIFVDHITGFYISKPEQLGGASEPEDARGVSEFDGILRFAMPVIESGKLVGVVSLALDHRHLMEFTQHLLPNSSEQIVFPSYQSGNYAFMFDDEGWIITHPKLWDIRGVDSTGIPVPAYAKNTAKEVIEQGRIPFNLDSSGFIHKNYPFVANEVRNGRDGIVITTNVGGVQKVMAYAPIPYNRGVYSRYGIFGGITLGANLDSFHQPAVTVHQNMNGAIRDTSINLAAFIFLTLVIAVVISWLISGSITRPVQELTQAAQNIAENEHPEPILARGNDEITVLTGVFNYMAEELYNSRSQLEKSLQELQESKNSIEVYAGDLEYQINILRSIQKISNILGTTFNFRTVLQFILQNSVKALSFDRAILYLLDPSGKHLACEEIFGFEPDEEKLARNSRYNIEKFDCIETRVVRTGKIIFVRDFKQYEDATELDRKIREVGKSNSFVFVPLKVQEKIIGILGADKLRSGNSITEMDINSLQILTNQASRVIENTRLYRALIEQHNFLEDVLRYMLNGLITVDSSGLITTVNRNATALLKTKRTELIGRRIAEIFPEDRETLREAESVLLKRGFFHGFNIQLHIDGEIKYFNINASLLGKKDHGVTGIIIILQDVTERKQIEERMQQLDRLASLGQFAAGIAHEIRNPLTGISLFLDDLHDRMMINPEIAGLLEKSLSEIERLESFVGELLEYSSPSPGERNFRNVNDLINSTLVFVEKQCKRNRITVSTNLDPELPRLLINSEKIRQALLNLILNAIQAMPDGGTMQIHSRLLDNGNAKPATAQIRICDSGSGIEPGLRSKIFDPFFTQRSGGTGLGLSITHSIISDHNGSISAAGSSSGGAQFTIELPITMEKTAMEAIRT
jgi:PAS domain S-box-containing protein